MMVIILYILTRKLKFNVIAFKFSLVKLKLKHDSMEKCIKFLDECSFKNGNRSDNKRNKLQSLKEFKMEARMNEL